MKTLKVDIPDVAFSTMRMDLKEMAGEMRNAAVVNGVCPFQYTEQEIEDEIY
jgi:hypothetical protein